MAIDPVNPAILYVASGNGGASKSVDGGAHWSDFNTGLINPDVVAMAVDPKTTTIVYAGTFGDGVFSYQFVSADAFKLYLPLLRRS